MTVRVERSFQIDEPPERVWAFIDDPANRARAISVVRDFTIHGEDGRRATWHVELPIPFVNRTITVETEELARDPPRYVEFVGRSKAMDVTGEHEIVETEDGCRLDNRFVVDGRLPGVERFFKKNFDTELENLRRAAERDLRRQRDEREGDTAAGDGA